MITGITNPIAIAALQGIRDRTLPTEPNQCSKTVRLVLTELYGAHVRELFGDSARESYGLFASAGFIHADDISLAQHGDIVFKPEAGKYGHVGIYVGCGLIFENSSSDIGRIRGALGFRTIEQFGGPVKIGRYKPKAGG